MSQSPTSGQPAPGVPLDDAQTRQWAGLSHLGGIFSVLPPLIVWLVFRERSAFVNQEGKKAVNFQITLLIGYVVLWFGALFVPYFLGFLFNLGIFAILIISLVVSIQGYQAVQNGKAYKYPFSLELIK